MREQIEVTPYARRSVRFLELSERDGWKVKVYGISAKNERPNQALVEASKEIAYKRLPLPAVAPNRYGLGVLIVHEGVDANYVLVDWWVNECILQNHVYTSELNDPSAFEYISPTGMTVCVWELPVLAFERDAWVNNILSSAARPNVEGYLSQRLNDQI
jgi:hypothetical protein